MEAIEALGLTSILTLESELDPEDIESQKAEDDLPLSELGQRNPGRFECVYDMLIWWPPSDLGRNAKIELLNADGLMTPVTLSEISPDAGRRRYRFARTEQPPSFARLRYADGGSSTLAIVSVADSLRQSAKESRGRKAEEAAAQLSEETNEGFWLLEALDVLETAEERQADDTKTITRTRPVKDKTEGGAAQHRTLDYDKFIEGRHLRSEEGGYQGSSLGGSDLSLVRGFLNRILGIVSPLEGQVEVGADEDLSAAFDMGDETSDPQRAIEGGEEFTKPPVPRHMSPEEAAEEKKRAQRARERRKAQREQIVGAVDAFDKRIQQRAENGLLNAIDILRLRALITVVAGAGSSGTAAKPSGGQSPLQVFAAAGDNNSWPRLLGRIIFVFFGGTRPAIRHLQLDASHSELSADVKECWTTCFWTMQACLAAARMHQGNRGMVKSLESLAQRLYAVTQLQRSELAGLETIGIISLMSERYAKRLGLEANAIESAHLLQVARVFKAPLLRA
jgi:hypothetical protein